MDPQRHERDRLMNALAEFAAFYANESRRRRGKTQPGRSTRSDILTWMGRLTPMERAAVTSTVDAAFVRLVIQMTAAPKSKSKARVDEFQVLRPSSKHGNGVPSLPFSSSAATFARRPVVKSRDGDDLIAPTSRSFDAAAVTIVANMRLSNTHKSCDTIGPCTSLTDDLDSFVALMDAVTCGRFLEHPPDAGTLKAQPWSELPWLKRHGYYSIATYVAHQMELRLWHHYGLRSHAIVVPAVGSLATSHLAHEWQRATLATQMDVLRRVAVSTKHLIQAVSPKPPTLASIKVSLGLLQEVMSPRQTTSMGAAPDTWFSCSLVEAGKRPQFAMVKLLWAEELQKECAALLSQSLAAGVDSSDDSTATTDLAPPTRKQVRKKAQAKQRKLKLRDTALHRTRLDAVLAQLKRTVQLKHTQRKAATALVAEVLADLVAQVCESCDSPAPASSPHPLPSADGQVRKKRKKKAKKKAPALPSPPAGPLRAPLLPLDLASPSSSGMFDSPGTPPPPPSYFDPFHQRQASTTHFFPSPSYHPPFELDRQPDETPFFLPRLFQEDSVHASSYAHQDQPATTHDWITPFSTLDWPHSFQWRHSETRLPTWMMEPPSIPQHPTTPPCSPPPSPERTRQSPAADAASPARPPLVMVDQATQATDTQEVTALQTVVDSNASTTAALQVEVAQLQHTVRELQAAVFALQKQQPTKAPLPPPPPPQTTHRHNNLFVSVPTSLLPPKTKLHWDICEYVTHLQAETHSRLAAHTAVSRFCVSAVQALWPRAQVRPYGSFVTGLSLPSSDLDLVICLPKVRRDEPAEAPGVLEGRNAIKETWQQHLSRKLRSESWVVPESVKTIPNASIPIITLLTTAPYHVRLDISFEGPGHNGLATNDLVTSFLHELPALAPLMLVLKTFVIDRGLGVAYTGGLSSYALLLMVTRFLQEFEVGNRTCHPEAVSTQCNLIVSTQSRTDFGTMLLGFLNFYGSKFDPRQTGISVASRCFLDRDALVQTAGSTATTMWHNVQVDHVQFENLNLSSPGSRRQNLHRDHWTGPTPFKPYDYDPHKFDPIYIEDPLRPGNNVGRNCFRIMQLRRALASAWSTLNLDGPLALPSHRYVGGVPLHPNNLLRSILTCTHEPKYKPHLLLPLEAPHAHAAAPPNHHHHTFQHHYQPHHHHTQPLASPPRQMHMPRQHSATKAKKQPTSRQDVPQRRHSECVNDVQSIIHVPSDDDMLRSPASARSLSFADVVVKQLQRKQPRQKAAASATDASPQEDDVEVDEDDRGGGMDGVGDQGPVAVDERDAVHETSTEIE